MKKSIKAFFEDSNKWQKEYSLLRKIILSVGLEEDFKWGKPCYTFHDNNIVLMHGFKEYCALLFHKGVLMENEENILLQQTENVQSARQVRFKNLQEINEQEKIIKEYIYEAIEVEKAGLEVEMKKTSDYEVPKELEKVFNENLDFKKAFRTLTPGRQRGYLLHFSGAKQSKTRESRIEKYKSKIFDGRGLNDK